MHAERARAIVIAGGGTGGHVFPGLALAAELQRRDPARPIEWIGARGGLEERLVPAHGFPLDLLPLGGMAGLSWRRRLSALALASWGTLRLARRFLLRRPRLVVGVGGFASGPAVLAALLLFVPTLVLEQNAVAGATNRLLARFVSGVAASFAESQRDLPGRVVVTGNPVREEIAAIERRPEGPLRTILGFGGSRGARALNDLWIAALPLLADLRLTLVLQTGADDLDRVCAAARANAASADVRPFLEDMPHRLASADLVVSRAGATTVAELAAAGRAAILIPFPHAAADHQTANARALEARGAALVVPQSELDAPRFAALIRALAADPARLAAMSSAARAAGRRQATRDVANLAEELSA